MNIKKIIISGIFFVVTISCTFLIPTDRFIEVPQIFKKVNLYENDAFIFTIPKGWKLTQFDGEYYDLGVERILTIENGGKPVAYFTVASAPLANGETLESRFALAYKNGPEIESVTKDQFERDKLSGIEISYKRPWGEPWWQFRDIWLERDSEIYVLSFHAYPNRFDSYTETYEQILSSFSFK